MEVLGLVVVMLTLDFYRLGRICCVPAYPLGLCAWCMRRMVGEEKL